VWVRVCVYTYHLYIYAHAVVFHMILFPSPLALSLPFSLCFFLILLPKSPSPPLRSRNSSSSLPPSLCPPLPLSLPSPRTSLIPSLLRQVITCSYVRQFVKVETGQDKLRFKKCADPTRVVGSSKVRNVCLCLFMCFQGERKSRRERESERERERARYKPWIQWSHTHNTQHTHEY
jgi:hypothetical protein